MRDEDLDSRTLQIAPPVDELTIYANLQFATAFFFSPALKTEIEKGAFPYLRFSEGLAEFAGR